MRHFLILLLAFPVTTYSAQLECPSSLAVENTATAPPGWTSFYGSTPHLLDRVGFYSGNPSEGASLVPDSPTKKVRESRDKWRFAVARNETIWLACFYTGIDVFLAKQLDRSITKCNVAYKTTKSGSRISIVNVLCD